MSDDRLPYGKPYGGDKPQIYTFSIHGTVNTAENVRAVATAISKEFGPIGKNGNMLDTFFPWDKLSGIANGTKEREEASNAFAKHAIDKIVEAVEAGQIDPKKGLAINLVGFSHGGNVAILASDNIAAGLKNHPLTKDMNVGIHLATLSTPAYTTGPESPAAAMKAAGEYGVTIKHTHFSVVGDTVAQLAWGNSQYDKNTTMNFPLPARGFNFIENHGGPQDFGEHIRFVKDVVRERIDDFRHNRADLGRDTAIASATTEMQSYGVQSPEFKNNATVQQVSAALERNGIAADQNPSLVAGLAGAAANLSKVQDVALTPQTAFALDRDKFDPAANRASVSMDVANKPFDEVWQKASVALQQTQAPAVVAQAQVQDVEQKSARAM
jgi:hypothetical protein